MPKANARTAISTLLLVLPLVLLAGCYSFTGGSLAYKTVAVPVAKNSTKEYRTTDAVTSNLISAITKDGRLKLMEPKDAASRFEMEVTGYARDPYCLQQPRSGQPVQSDHRRQSILSQPIGETGVEKRRSERLEHLPGGQG